MQRKFISFTSEELNTLPKDKTVFFFPVGPLESFGPHLPLGLHLSESEKICNLLADRMETELNEFRPILMPSAPLGIDGNSTSFKLTVRGHVLRDWLVDACTSLHQEGFWQFVCVSSQTGPKQLTAIEEAQSFLNRRTKKLLKKTHRPILISASSGWISAKDVFRSPFWSTPQEHGGKRDTSVALWIAPEQVQKHYLHLPLVEAKSIGLRRFFGQSSENSPQYWGAPAEGRAELGQKDLDEKIEIIWPKLKNVWLKKTSPRHFRTWYSLFPPNRTFFKAWVLFILIALLMVFWSYFMFRHLFGL
jgi:creatinine amidohydrolase/Fe(II)-dependent formamide hydrolase-like protein